MVSIQSFGVLRIGCRGPFASVVQRLALILSGLEQRLCVQRVHGIMLLVAGHVTCIQEFLVQLDLQLSEWMTKVFVV